MSISFSGLASGLDTSSWVESLVKLKQAKITTLEEQKENVLLSKETLNGIKAFFSSFRSMIEKITDTKFGVASMDLFAQNLATSSNVNVLTGFATAEAEEATYNILVDKLATETNVLSRFNCMTTIVQTTTATSDSKLIHLGVNTGNIGVTVDGVERVIGITDNDTIATFIDKLRNIGAEANYNEKTGVFSININSGAINDIDGTGIIDALHLSGVNEGYTSNNLQTSAIDTVYSPATETTLLKELGVSDGVVGIKADDADYNITITESTTLGEFINALRDNNIDASLNTEGIFTISDAEIISEGTTNILDALGLEANIYNKTQATGNLTNRVTITQSTTATSSTLLKDLGEGLTITDDSTVIISNSANELTTITVGETSTIGDLLNAMSDAGLSASINSNGIVEINNGTIVGGSFDVVSALGLESAPNTASVTGNPLTATTVRKENVTLNTRLVEDMNVRKGYLEVTDNDGNKNYLKIHSGQTFSNLKSDLEALGISCSLDETNGILTITGGSFRTLADSEVTSLIASGDINETDSDYSGGTDLLEHLYGAGTISTDHITVNSAYARSQALTHTVTNTVNATSETTLENLGLTTDGTAIFDVNGTKYTINVEKTNTIQELVNVLNTNGISASWDNDSSKLTIENAVLSDGTSDLSAVLNLSETVYGKYTTSNSLYSKTISTANATRETTLKDFGILDSMSEIEKTVDVYSSDGTKVGSINVSETSTIGDLIDFINSNSGISASIENGTLKINNGYIENSTLESSMGLEKANQSSYALGSIHTTTITSAVTGESKLGSIISAMGTTSDVSGGYNLSFNGSNISVNADSSLNDIISAITAQGGFASLDSSGRLTVNGGTLSGSVATALGITSSSNITAVTSTGKSIFASQEVFADTNTKLSDLGITSSSYTIKNSSGTEIKTENVSGDNTLEEFFNTLRANNINGTISDGVITLQSNNGNYIEGDLANTLGITSHVTTTVISTTQSSANGVTFSENITADLTTTLGQIGAVQSSGDNNILVYNEASELIKTIDTLTATSTIEDMFNALSAYGITGTISNGVISLSSTNGNYVDGTIMERLGISPNVAHSGESTIAISISSNSPLTSTVHTNATYDTKMSVLVGMTGSTATLEIENTAGTIQNVLISGDMTVQEFFDALSTTYSVSGTIENGVISLTHSSTYTLGGTVATDLGLTNTKTVLVGSSSTSTGQVLYTTEKTAVQSDKISDYIDITTDNRLDIYDKENQLVDSTVITTNTTFDDLITTLGGYHLNVSMANGILSFTSDDGWYVSGPIAEKLGIEVIKDGNIPLGQISSDYITAVVTKTATMDSTVMDFLPDASVIDISHNGSYQIGSITLASDDTFQTLATQLKTDYDINLTIDSNGRVKVSSDSNNTISGSLADELGLTTDCKEVLINPSMSNLTATKTVISYTTSDGSDSGAYTIDGSMTASSITGNIIAISTEQDLRNLASLVNSGQNMSGKTFILCNDINITSNFTPIGNATHSFNGTFDGGGYAIKNLNMTIDTATTQAGLFGNISNAKIKDLKITNANVTITNNSNNDFNFGMVAAVANNSVMERVSVQGLNCIINSTISADGTISTATSSATIIAPIIARAADSTLKDCSANGSIVSNTTSSDTVTTSTTTTDTTNIIGGGLVGYMTSTHGGDGTIQVSGCTSDMIFSGEFDVAGGVIGQVSGISSSEQPLVVNNNKVNTKWTFGDNTKSNTEASIGGVIGSITENTASININNNFVDSSYGGNLHECSRAKAGEIVGYTNGSTNIENNAALHFSIASSNTLAAIGESSSTTGNNNYVSKDTGNVVNFLQNNFSSSAWNITSDGATVNSSNGGYTTDYYGQSYYNNSPSPSSLTETVSEEITTNTYLRDIVGMQSCYDNNTAKITVVNDSGSHEIQLSQLSKVSDLISKLAEYGVNASVENHKFKISESSTGYIESIDADTSAAFKINAGKGYSYTDKSYNSSSSTIQKSTSHTMASDTKLSDLGITDNSTITYKEWNNSTNTYDNKSLTFASDSTMTDIVNALNAANISASITNGKITIGDENDDVVVDSMSTPLKNALKLTVGKVDASGNGTYKENLVESTTQKQVTLSSSPTLSTKINSLLDASGTLTSTSASITVVQNGTEHVVDISYDNTFEEMFNTLKTYGINGQIQNGKVIFDGSNAYIKGMSNGLDNLLGLTLGENISYTTSADTTHGNTQSNKLEFVKTSVLTKDKVLSDISSYSGGNNELWVIKDGNRNTISISATGTVDDFFLQIAAYGLTGTIDSSGTVTISGVGDTYLQTADGGSNILSTLNLSDVSKETNVTTSITPSNVLKYTKSGVATLQTTIESLIDSENNRVELNGNDKAVIEGNITDQSGNTTRYSAMISKTSTLQDVINEYAKIGITATINADGTFSVSTNSLQDYDLQGALDRFLMGNYTKNYETSPANNVSGSLFEKKVIKMNDETKLSDLGITNGDILVSKNGVQSTVNIDTTTIETVGDFRDFLSLQGFTSNIYSQGRISVSGVGNSYLSTIADGSNILTELGLTDWDMGEITQSSDALTYEKVEVSTINMSNKLSELTDAAGTALDITSGQVSVYHNGTRSVLNIDANDTLDSLANKLSRFGITINLASDGKLYFNGSNNSYLSKDGIEETSQSNILDKIGIADAWTFSGKSTSQKLQYQEQVTKNIDLNTKLKDLKDSSGNDLGITDGAFYVYSNGVRNTETLDTNMSVGDFISLMDTYGIDAEVLTNGSISLKAKDNSYLATSAISGDNSNIVSKLFSNYDFQNAYKSEKLEVSRSETKAINRNTKLSDINEGTFQSGYISLVKNGINTNISVSDDDTVGTLIDNLALYGFSATVNRNGQLVMNSTGEYELKNYTGAEQASNVLDILGVNDTNWIKTSAYEGSELNVVNKSTVDAAATRDTLLSELGVTTGEYYIYKNGVKYTAVISSDDTLGSFMNTLKSFGLETNIVQNEDGSVLSIIGQGDSYITKSSKATNASNVVETLFSSGVSTSYEYNGVQQTSETVTVYSAATEDTLLSYYDNEALKAEGNLSVNVNGSEKVIKITASETFGTLIDKLNALGVEATMTNGQLMIQSGYNSFTINTSGTTSNLQATINLMYNSDLGGYIASTDTVLATTTTIEEKTYSVSNYADDSTKLGQLNISNGILTVYRDGQKATVQIDSEETFGDLKARLSAAFSDLDLKFEDGYLTIYSKDGHSVEVGSTSDKTNFLAITGLEKDENGVVKSARELYRVNGDSVITNSGLFRSGNVKEGTFIVGSETFTIDSTTTLSDIISQINSNKDANATAYWDNIQGRLVIKSRTTGAAYVNIEAGTSNFTDIMGFTTSEWEADGKLSSTRMNINAQEIGQNARISINGTNYTSTSNTITSDVSRIKGLTINLNGLTDGSAVTLTVEKDKETLANAISDVVDSYNELMKNVDEAISREGKLHKETTLKMIRNNLRNLMTSSDTGTTTFRNLSAIGISTSSASANNISTTNESIINLAFDKEKFIEAYEADSEAVKALLTGSETNKGIFTKVEELVESTLQSVTGYFATADNTYTKRAETIERKIVNGTKSIERYRARLEARFSSMDMLIANMQQQYSSFLVS